MKRVEQFINIQNIRIDRLPLNPSTLSLVDHIRNGGDIPPIQVSKHPNGGYSIKDGRHRLVACKLLGKSTINAKFSIKAEPLQYSDKLAWLDIAITEALSNETPETLTKWLNEQRT